MADRSDLHDALLKGDASAAACAARRSLDEGVAPAELVSKVIGPAMREVGELFQAGEYFVPELLMSARATKGVFEILRPLLAKQGVAPAGRVLLGTVKGDLHDIGKNLVGAMLEGAGFEVVDLGVDVPPEGFVTAVEQRQPTLVGLSALLTTTMQAMKSTLEALRTSGVRDRIKVMVGGAPVTRGFSESIGADGYAEDAACAVALARQLAG
jgi:5-methyltetrahydrofolate--homocysteine methyltransferase